MKIQKPATPTGLNFGELNDSLLLVWAHRVEKDVSTVHGPKNAIAADVHVVDGRHAGEVFRDTLIFPAVLVTQLKGSVGSGDPTLGRLTQGVAKKGQSPPWILPEPTDDELKLAAAYIEGLPAGAAELGETGGDDEPPF